MPSRPLQVMSQAHGDGASLVGSRAQRRCTDAACCLVFLLSIGAMVLLGFAGLRYGDQSVLVRFAHGRDFKGRICGMDPEVKDFALTYYTFEEGTVPAAPANWTSADRSKLKPVCTSICPQAAAGAPTRNVTPRESGLCPPEMSPKFCTWYGANTIQLADYCVDANVFYGDLDPGHWLQDLKASSVVLAVMPFVAIFIGFCFLCFVDRCGACCIWVALAVFATVPAAVGVWVYLDAQGATSGATDPSHEIAGLSNMKPETRRNIAYSLWGMSALVLLLCCCFFGTVRGVVGVLKTTSKFLEHVPSQMIQPVLVGLAQLVVFAAWLAVFVQVGTIGVEEGDQAKCLEVGDLYCIQWNSNARFYGMTFLILMLYWMINFLHALSHFGTSYAVYAWYFAPEDPVTGRREPQEGGHSLCDCRLSVTAFCHGFMRHPGSLAMGSFVIALARVGQLLLWWAHKNEEMAPQNPLLRAIRRCIDCLADCFARFIEFVSEHAYVEMALTGEGFCTSAKRGAALAVMHPALFALVGRVVRAVWLLGTVVITAGTAYSAVLILIWFPVEALTSTRVPVIVSAIGGFVVSQVLLHPFSAAARACLHCLCLDEKEARALGPNCSPTHTPAPMQHLVEQHMGEEPERGCCARCFGCCP